MFIQRGRPRQGSFITIITAVMVTTLVGMQQSANGQMATHYVCENACLDWPLASSDLWTVMKDAEDGDVIWVAQGEYHPVDSNNPGDIENSFELKAGVQVYGNFIGNEGDLDERQPLNTDYESILDGTLGSSAALHVVRVDGGGSQRRVIDGFTIRNGHARGYVGDCVLGAPPPHANFGGGMLVTDAASPDVGIVMCRFEDNLAGAGTCPPGVCEWNSQCGVGDFRGHGGALALVYTTSQDGGNVRIHNCTFTNNRVVTGEFGNSNRGPVGGALYVAPGFGVTEVMNSLFVGNVVDAEAMPCCFGSQNVNWGAFGGAIAFGNTSGCPAPGSFPPPYVRRLWNCTIYGNEVHSTGSNLRKGRGIWSDSSFDYDAPLPPDEPSFEHAVDPFGWWLTVVNTIVHGNRAASHVLEQGLEYDEATDEQISFTDTMFCSHPPYVAYSNIGGSWSGYGNDNIHLDPLFVDAPGGDFRLSAGSPSIDAGAELNIPLDVLNISRTTNHATLLVPDLDHKPRRFGCAVDMGAFERQWFIAEDLNGDGLVDFADLLILLSAWGVCPGGLDPCPGDFNGDGEVNFTDLLAMLGAWANHCPESAAELGSVEECIARLGLSNPEALAACIEAMLLNGTP